MIRTSTTTEPGVLSGHSLGEVGLVATDSAIHDARVVSYVPASGANWNDPDPTTVQGGLDNAAAGDLRVYALAARPFVTIGTDTTLSAERALAVGTGLSLTDGGANSTATIGVDAAALAALLDHGTLLGLADDDHTIYFKADGTRNVTGTSTITTTSKWQFRDTATWINSNAANQLTIEGATKLTLAGDTVEANDPLRICATTAKYSLFGPLNAATGITPADANDKLVVAAQKTSAGIQRAGLAIAEIIGPANSATARVNSLSAFAVFCSTADTSSTSTATFGGLCAGRYLARVENYATLTVASACALSVALSADPSDTTTITLYDDIRLEGTASSGQSVISATGTVTTWQRIRIQEPVLDVGATLTTLYGVRIAEFDVATNNYEIMLDGNGGIFFREAANCIYSSATTVLNVDGTGDIRIQCAAAKEVVINDGAASADFRVESDTKTNMFLVDGSADKIGINQSGPAGAVVHITNTSGTVQPLLRLDQDDAGTAYIDFDGTIDTGAHVTVTNWAKVTTGNGAATKYIPLYD